MKKKSRLFLNIATIALCLCAIAVGVYSAKTASLNVGGTVGFVAHNCEVEVVGKITGATNTAGSDTAGTYYITKTQASAPKTESEIINVGGSSGTSSAYFGNLHFTHNSDANANDIVMEFTITNKSAFDIKASIKTNDDTTVTGLTLKAGVTASITNNNAEISANASDTIKLTISVAESVDKDLADAVTGGISFNFAKKEIIKLSANGFNGTANYTTNTIILEQVPEKTTSNTIVIPSQLADSNGVILDVVQLGSQGEEPWGNAPDVDYDGVRVVNIDDYDNIVLSEGLVTISNFSIIRGSFTASFNTITIPSTIQYFTVDAFCYADADNRVNTLIIEGSLSIDLSADLLGCVLTSIYIKTGATVPSTMQTYFAKQSISDKTGYDKWMKNS